jgi:hypothetical protein
VSVTESGVYENVQLAEKFVPVVSEPLYALKGAGLPAVAVFHVATRALVEPSVNPALEPSVSKMILACATGTQQNAANGTTIVAINADLI